VMTVILNMIMLLLVVIMVIAAIVKVRDDDLHLALVEAHEFALVKDAALASVHSLELKYKVPVGMELGVDEKCVVRARSAKSEVVVKARCAQTNDERVKPLVSDDGNLGVSVG